MKRNRILMVMRVISRIQIGVKKKVKVLMTVMILVVVQPLATLEDGEGGSLLTATFLNFLLLLKM